MGKKVLSIVESAYRATLEEQDDTIIWINQAMKNAGADVDILLRGNAVNYAVKGQNAEGLSFGEWKQTQPPRIDQDLEKAASKGVQVFVVREDVGERGLEGSDLIGIVKPIERSGLPKLFAGYDQVWHW